MQDASVYYLLGYSREPEHNDGRFHPIEVRVKRPDVTVRARRGYYAARLTVSPVGAPPVVPQRGLSSSAADALRLPVSVKGLGVSVAAVPFKGTGRDESVSVLLVARIDGQAVSEEGRSMTVGYRIHDVEGKIIARLDKGFRLAPADKIGDRGDAASLRFVDQVALRPGRYELRFVAEYEGGRVGSVVTPLEARPMKEPLAMSGVILAVRDGKQEFSLPNDMPPPVLARIEPTVARAFRHAETLKAFAEIYVDGRTKPAEIAVTGTIRRAEADIVAQIEATRVPALTGDDGRRLGFETELPLRNLAAGEYVLTLEARSLSRRDRSVSRRIPFTVQE